MIVKPGDYVPSLRWRTGEYQALSRLSDAAKARVVPFIVIPEIEFDFEEWADKKTVQEHVEAFPKRYKAKWGMRPAWIDVHPKIIAGTMDDGRLPIQYAFDELAKVGSNAVSVTSLDAPSQVNVAVAAIVKKDRRGVGIRARIEHIMKPSFAGALATLLGSIGIQPKDADLILDLGAPNYEPYDDFADGLMAALSGVDTSAFRNFILMGCAYPETVALDKPGGDLTRHDWLFYRTFIAKLEEGERIPNFSDYTIVNPEFTPRDMRMIKSGGKVVYTMPKTWFVRKGGAFRDNPAQMHDHCDHIVSSGKFRGPGFSSGDEYIQQCAKKAKGPSNQPWWKFVAINHHIMHVLDDLAKFDAAA
ncbi:hypothetical protein ACVWWI_000185 [Bradyrhizobium sp. USDA 3686]|uniref:beta family protein n=1 Tax=Bradyrhizobium canariense TaxID=255045 RepID=UPI00195A88D5|nr:beta family protein [Bradyrhizobium canariense]MBM7486699.1 hypothetical protein [Bradyrhizobium canariense]